MADAPIAGAHMRVARPTDNIDALQSFYCDGLGLTVLGEFKDHDDFDGLIIGSKSASYHLEFTTKRGHSAGRAPTRENLLVFYLRDIELWKKAVESMESAGHQAVKSFNPYWDAKGRTFEDADGYRVVLQNAGWNNEDVARRYHESKA